MAHKSETSSPLKPTEYYISAPAELLKVAPVPNSVYLIRIPGFKDQGEHQKPLIDIGKLIAKFADNLEENTVVVILGETVDLAEIQIYMSHNVRYQAWIAIERHTPLSADNRAIPNAHFGALIHTTYQESLLHTRTRIAYTYCPFCDRTTSDYGGKKHTYHEYGTSISDVWLDTKCDPSGDISPLIDRFSDLFGLEPYHKLTILNCLNFDIPRASSLPYDFPPVEVTLSNEFIDHVIPGDSIQWLKKIPDNSVDFAFVDPPYNLKKKYFGYADNLEMEHYLAWCNEWLRELVRVLKPGRTLAVLNIPILAVQHYEFLQHSLNYQNWIVWDALAFPVRMIMPAHYSIVCFSKGISRELPGLTGKAGRTTTPSAPKVFRALEPLAEDYCIRASCIDKRIARNINDKAALTDIWSDIHRLKHNSRRVDHPCQLPPHLMYRLIGIFTQQGEIVLDCFNGAGTTTLTAHQLDRHYLGFDISEKYCQIANERHAEIRVGLDPFRKEERVLTAKNSPVQRLPKQKYVVSKKVLQLEVRRVAQELGHLPSRDEMLEYGKYPIEYYDNYFVSWGEVCAAARTTGMTEFRTGSRSDRGSLNSQSMEKQMNLFDSED